LLVFWHFWPEERLIQQGECAMRFKSSAGLMAVAFAGLFVANRASAQVSLDANLDSFQEYQPHNTPGYGSADLTLTGTTLSINAGTGLYADLLAGATSVVLGDGAPATAGTTIGPFNLDTYGNTTGTFSGSVTGLTNQQVMDVLAGNTFINIRDSVYPSGEIRGQIFTVPEPGSLAVLGGMGLLALRRRGRA
jgi:hypothetical protein